MNVAWVRSDKTEKIRVGRRTIVVKNYTYPDGTSTEFHTYDPENSHTVAILAITPEGKIIISRQYRPGTDSVMEELPGGGYEAIDESFEVAAVRELLEETGYQPEAIEKIGISHKNSYSNTTQHYFWATGCKKVQEPSPDEGEFIEVDLIDVDTLLKNMRAAAFSDVAIMGFAYERLMALRGA